MTHSPYLTTTEAAAYLRFKTASGIRMAVLRRELVPRGAGPRGTHLFSVEELDRFVGARLQRRVSFRRRRAALAKQIGVRNEAQDRNEDEVSRSSDGGTRTIPRRSSRMPAASFALAASTLLSTSLMRPVRGSGILPRNQTQTKKLTGQRFCHVSALKWSDIDWGEMVIRFRRKQVRGVVGPISRRKPVPKEIPILPELGGVLLAHGRRNGKLGYPVGVDDWIFPSRTATLKQPSSLRNAIKRSAGEAGLGNRRITPHMMRYLFNDVLRQAGVDQVTRKSLTGHVTDEMTEHYSTVRLDEKRAAMAAAAAMLRDEKVGTSVGTAEKSGGG